MELLKSGLLGSEKYKYFLFSSELNKLKALVIFFFNQVAESRLGRLLWWRGRGVCHETGNTTKMLCTPEELISHPEGAPGDRRLIWDMTLHRRRRVQVIREVKYTFSLSKNYGPTMNSHYRGALNIQRYIHKLERDAQFSHVLLQSVLLVDALHSINSNQYPTL